MERGRPGIGNVGGSYPSVTKALEGNCSVKKFKIKKAKVMEGKSQLPAEGNFE